jgi:hypothetical protein
VVSTDGAALTIRYHHTFTAVSDIIAQTVDGGSEMVHILLRLLEQMQGKTQSTPASYTGQ